MARSLVRTGGSLLAIAIHLTLLSSMFASANAFDVVDAQQAAIAEAFKQALATTDVARKNIAATSQASPAPVPGAVLPEAEPNQTKARLDAEILKINNAQSESIERRAENILLNTTSDDKDRIASSLEAQAQTLKSVKASATLTPTVDAFVNRSISARESAARSLRASNEPLPPLDTDTAEAIVSATRLAFVICGNTVPDQNRIVTWQKDIDRFVASHSDVFQTVGRLESFNLVQAPDGSQRVSGPAVPFATSFAIDHDLVMTNAHVLSFIADFNKDTHEWTLNSYKDVWVDFGAEYPPECAPPKGTRYRIKKIVAVSLELDAAILMTSAPTSVPFIDVLDAVDPSPQDAVVVIGFPDEDARVPREEAEHVFGNAPYQIKRFAPGKVSDAIYPFEGFKQGRDFEYDASTLGGSSGSPVFRLTDGSFIGLHHNGLLHKANSATKAKLLIDFVAQSRPAVRASPLSSGTAASTTEAATRNLPADGVWELFMDCPSSARLQEPDADFFAGQYTRLFDDGAGNKGKTELAMRYQTLDTVLLTGVVVFARETDPYPVNAIGRISQGRISGTGAFGKETNCRFIGQKKSDTPSEPAIKTVGTAYNCHDFPGVTFTTKVTAAEHCLSDVVVWLNTKSCKYYLKGQRYFANTNRNYSGYACEKDAKLAGAHQSENNQ